jgi:hypothetical protein
VHISGHTTGSQVSHLISESKVCHESSFGNFFFLMTSIYCAVRYTFLSQISVLIK